MLVHLLVVLPADGRLVQAVLLHAKLSSKAKGVI